MPKKKKSKPKKLAKKPVKQGRPKKLTEKDKEKMIKLARYGFTDKEIADVFCVTEQTLTNYKNDDAEFFGSIKAAKSNADLEVIDSLFNRAKGYSCIEEKQFFDAKNNDVITHQAIKQYPPDPTSMIFWLKNRQPEKFREKQKEELEADKTINIILPSEKIGKL